MWIRVLSGSSPSRSLSLNCFRCAMKIPVQSRKSSDILGCDRLMALSVVPNTHMIKQ
ncbi:hypothetical protein Hdeb2414_s0019g00551791 [Helianthus debilis subsp. tardiflorus]